MRKRKTQFAANNFKTLHTQICFWEVRQYEELCNAFGRHLLNILDLPERSQRALAWIFPRTSCWKNPTIFARISSSYRDIVAGLGALATVLRHHASRNSRDYHHEHMHPRKVDNYYLEPLGNAIPRERIFEIWKSTTGTVRIFGKTRPITEAITRYGDVLKTYLGTCQRDCASAG